MEGVGKTVVVVVEASPFVSVTTSVTVVDSKV